MRRGTTPTHSFDLADFNVALIKRIKVTYAQGAKVVLEKRDEEITIDGNKAVVKLTQEETLEFVITKPIEVQVRILTTNGDALASQIVTINPLRMLDDEVLV